MIGKEGVESPVEIKADAQTQTDSYVRLTAGPWENGYGHTIGNALRRVLLSSMEGVAVTSIKIDDVQHEFTSIPGVMEDVMEIVLNIKKLKFNCVGQLPRTIELKADRRGPVTAACIVEDPVVEVLNKDQLICTLDTDRPSDKPFRIEMNIDRGRGYRKSEDNKTEDQPLGTIPVDSLFSPVESVRYYVQPARVGQHTDYDRLEMEIKTDCRILPLEALTKSAAILRDLFAEFVIDENSRSKNEMLPPSAALNDDEKALVDRLVTDVSELELSVRAVNCLNSANIQYLGELVEKSENQMLKYRNFGRKSLLEIKQKLSDMDLSLEMNLPDSVKDELNRRLEEKQQSQKTEE